MAGKYVIMDESLKHAEWKKPDQKVKIIWLYRLKLYNRQNKSIVKTEIISGCLGDG